MNNKEWVMGGCSCHNFSPCGYCMSLSEEDWAADQNKRFYSPTELCKKLKAGGFKEIKMRGEPKC